MAAAAPGAPWNTRTGAAQLWRLQNAWQGRAVLVLPCPQLRGKAVPHSLGQVLHHERQCQSGSASFPGPGSPAASRYGCRNSAGGAPTVPVLRNNTARIPRQQILNLDAWGPPRRALDLHSAVIWEWERFILAEPGCANRKYSRHF